MKTNENIEHYRLYTVDYNYSHNAPPTFQAQGDVLHCHSEPSISMALVEASAASTEAGDSDGAGPGCITECVRCKESSLKAPLPAEGALVHHSAGKVYCRHHRVGAQGNFSWFTVHKLRDIHD